MSTLLLLLTGVAGTASSDCSIEGVLLSSSPDDSLSGGGLLSCCAADCLGVCSAATMTCANGLNAVVWAGWLVGVWVVVLNSCSATMCELRVFL